MTLGLALVHRHTDAERDRGQKLLAEVGDVFVRRGHNLCDLPIVNVYLARERARRGDRDEAIPLMRAAVDHLFREGQLLAWGIPATGVLVETLLDRGAEGDVAEAEAAIERLAAAPADDGLAMRDIWLLRLRALLARAHGDDAAYRDFRDRYRAMAESLGFEGHIAWAEAMVEGSGALSQLTSCGLMLPAELASTASQHLDRFQPSRMDHRIHRRSEDEHSHGDHPGPHRQRQHIPVDFGAVVHR